MMSHYCCVHAWKSAKEEAWINRPINECRCDHNEYCHFCYQPEFRKGGYWEQVKPKEPKP